MSLDIKILEIYGMSEICGPQTGNDYKNYRFVVSFLLDIRDNNIFLVMSQQRQYSRKDNFGSSNTRVSERDFWYSLQGLFLDTVEETDWQEQLIS